MTSKDVMKQIETEKRLIDTYTRISLLMTSNTKKIYEDNINEAKERLANLEAML
ncbi:MAG: hypothetical protein ACRC5M_00245 [Anaeroplasmataceae bacterium]